MNTTTTPTPATTTPDHDARIDDAVAAAEHATRELCAALDAAGFDASPAVIEYAAALAVAKARFEAATT
jgi:hypothetical protein